MQKQRSAITQVQKNQSMGRTCIYLEIDTILFHLQIVCHVFLLSFFVQNKIKVIIPMTL